MKLFTDYSLTTLVLSMLAYVLIFFFIISLAACKKKGFDNLKKSPEHGIVNELMEGLFIGLTISLFIWIIGILTIGLSYDMVFGLFYGLPYGLIYAVFVGWGNEFEEESVQSQKPTQTLLQTKGYILINAI